jgi:uncharacterized membrane protein YheB (UPF0754 family)
MHQWPQLIINETKIELTHLNAFEFSCSARDVADVITVRVRFNDHCFTKRYNEHENTLNDIVPKQFSNRTEQRVFCKDRYLLSYQLPHIIKSLQNKRIASTRNGNLVRTETAEGQTYAVFFTLRKFNARVVDLFVVSAYPITLGKTIADTGEMKFDLALAKTIRGEKPRFPRR